MPFVIAGLVVVGTVCLLDLVLTLAVVRRLRQHTEQLSNLLSNSFQDTALPVGAAVAEFAGTTVDGAPVSHADLAGTTLVGFFSPGCAPCAEELPRFVERSTGAAERVLAVVVLDAPGTGPDHGGTTEIERLRVVGHVVTEPRSGPVCRAFGVNGFPTLFLVRDGVVVATGHSVEALLVPAAR